MARVAVPRGLGNPEVLQRLAAARAAERNLDRPAIGGVNGKAVATGIPGIDEQLPPGERLEFYPEIQRKTAPSVTERGSVVLHNRIESGSVVACLALADEKFAAQIKRGENRKPVVAWYKGIPDHQQGAPGAAND